MDIVMPRMDGLQAARAIRQKLPGTKVIIVSQNGKIIRIESSTIRQAGRSTSGVKLVSLDGDDKVAAASVIPETEDNGGQGDLPIQ